MPRSCGGTRAFLASRLRRARTSRCAARWCEGSGCSRTTKAPAVLAEPYPELEVSPSLAPAMPDGVFVNLTRTGVDKGYAVRLIATECGVELET